MAFTFETAWPFASSADSGGRTYQFIATGQVGVDDDDEDYYAAMSAVWAHALANFASTPDGLTPQSIANCETLGLFPVPRYRVEVAYGSASAPVAYEQAPTGGMEFAFDVSVQSQHVNFALEHLDQVMAAGKTAPTTTAIGVDSQGVVQGIDILVPTSQFTLNYYPANAVITDNWKRIVENTVGKVNDATFGHRAAGEVFLLGASGSKRTNEDWRLSFSFAVRKNRAAHDPPTTIFTVNGIDITFDVKGWELLDPIVEPEQGEDKVQPKVIGFNRLRIYESADFSALALPGYP